MTGEPCAYCGRPGLTFKRGLVVCARCIDLPRLEPGAIRERPLLRPPTRGLSR